MKDVSERNWRSEMGKIITAAAFLALIGAPVALLSTSPERDDTILVTDPFED